MQKTLHYAKLFYIFITVLPLISSCSSLPKRRSWMASQSDPYWGDLKPQDILANTIKRSIFERPDGSLFSDGGFPMGFPTEGPKINTFHKILQPGEKLLIKNLEITSGISVSFNTLHTIDSTGKSIELTFTAGTPSNSRFTEENLNRYGFRMLRTE